MHRRPATSQPTRTGSARRSRTTRRAVLVLLLVPLIAGLFGVAAAGPTRGDELTDAVARQKALETQIAAQKVQVARLTVLQADLKAQIGETARALSQVNADLSTVRKQVGKINDQIAITKAAYEALVTEYNAQSEQLARISLEEWHQEILLAERKARLAARLRAAYATNRTTLMETILSGGSFAEVLTDVGYYLDVGEQDRALARQIAQNQAELAVIHQSVVTLRQGTADLRDAKIAQKAELDARLADLKRAREQLKKLERETANALAAQRAAYEKLARNKAALRDAIANAAAAQRKLEDRIEELLRQRYARGGIPSEYSGSLAWPLAGTITQEYGCTGFGLEPPQGNCAHFHKGIDIAADMYTPVTAAGNGTVLFAGPNPYDRYPKAWIVVIAHSQNLVTWYAHVDNATRPPAVRAGDVVREGQVIAYVGMTGRTTGPHLHWMVQSNDSFVNPRLFI